MIKPQTFEELKSRIAVVLVRNDAIIALRRKGVRIGHGARPNRIISAVGKIGFTRAHNESDLEYLERFGSVNEARSRRQFLTLDVLARELAWLLRKSDQSFPPRRSEAPYGCIVGSTGVFITFDMHAEKTKFRLMNNRRIVEIDFVAEWLLLGIDNFSKLILEPLVPGLRVFA